MRGSVVIAGALIGTAALIGAPAQAVATAPDPYSGSIETDCRVSVPADVEPGKKIVITIRVAANNAQQPTGKVDLTIRTRPDNDVLWTKTVRYNGGTQKVVGPEFPAGKELSVSSKFRPDNNDFARCSGTEPFAVDSANDGNPDDNDDNGPGGLLPDTGGPALLWLLLGLSLVGGGAATVVYARRRSHPDAAAA